MWETTGYLYGVGQSPKGHQYVKECVMAMSKRMRCNPGRFRLDKTDLKVVLWSDFKNGFSPYLAASLEVRYFQNVSVGGN